MTSDEFRASLKRRGVSQVGFAREIEEISGMPMPLRTVQSWAIGEAPIPAPAVALVRLLERNAQNGAAKE